MLCECCGHKIIKKRHFNNLFDKEIHHICEKCYRKKPIILSEQVIPIEQGKILWYNLCIDVIEKPLAYMSFLGNYIKHYQSLFDYDLMIYMDEFNDYMYQLLDSLKLGNIYLLTLYENITKKGE